MIPYFEWKTFALGPLTIQVWGLFAALGVVAGFLFARREAKRRGLDLERFESLAFRTVVAAFVGARILHVIAYEPAYYAANPLEALMIWKAGWSSFGGFLGAAAAFFWEMRKKALPLWKTADALTLAVPLGLGCGRIGCFLIHDHPGTLAHGVGRRFAVAFPDGPRYDLGLLLGLVDFAIFAWFLLLMRKPRRDGAYFALFMAVYGPARFGLDFLRATDVRYGGLTPAQYGAIILTVIGSTLFFHLQRKEASR